MVGLKSILQTIFFLLVGIVLIWLSVKDITADQWESMRMALGQGKYIWLAVSIVLALLSHVSRSIRWQMLLEPLGKKPAFWNCFVITMIGYLGNLAINRLGEAMRVGLMTKYEGIPADKVLGTIIADRAFDVICLLLVTIASFAIYYDKLGTYGMDKLSAISEKFGELNYGLLAIIGIVGLVALVFLFTRSKGIFGKVGGVVRSIGAGLVSVKDVKNPIVFLFHTVFIWLMYFGMITVCLYVLPETGALSPLTGFALLTFGSIAMIVTPGGIGSYPIVIAEILSIFGISFELGTALGWIIWANQTALVIVAGLICWFVLPLINRNEAENTSPEQTVALS